MRLVCGQCGRMHKVKPGPQISVARCGHCAHEIFIGQFTQDAPPPIYDESNPLFGALPDGSYADRAKQMLSERLLLSCNHCGSRLLVGKRLSGQVIACQQCKGEVHVPFVDEGEFDDSYLQMSMPRSLMDATEMISQTAQKKMRDRRRKQQNRFAVLAVAGVFVLLVLLAVVVFSSIRDKDVPDNYTSTGTGSKRPGTTRPKPPRPATVKSKSRYLGGKWTWYAAGRNFPAEPGRVYLRIQAELQTGKSPVQLQTCGGMAKLHYAGKVYESLGVPADGSPLPLAAYKQKVHFNIRETKAVTFLFNIPRRSGEGELRIAGFPPLGVKLAMSKPDTNFAGAFRELSPRSLPLAKAHPVVAAIRKAGNHVVRIERRAGQYLLAFDKARISGQGKDLGKGMCAMTLRGESGPELACQMQLLPGGNELLLHLGTGPRRQIAFQRLLTKLPEPVSPTESAGPVVVEQDRIEFPEDDGKGPSFFGVPVH